MEAASDRDKTSSSFVDNMRLPVHRWFRYSAGFSAEWVEGVIRSRDGPVKVFDPFAGAATTLIAAEKVGAECYGVEAHPFVGRVAKAKLAYKTDPASYIRRSKEVFRLAGGLRGQVEGYPPLIRKCFNDQVLEYLDRLRIAWTDTADGSPESELVWLTLVAMLRLVSHAGTAPWQYVLPRKTKKKAMSPTVAFEFISRMIANDMRAAREVRGPHAVLLESDARTCADVPSNFADLVITSPPYANNYDYADATRLEMCFMGEIRGWADLQSTIRHRLIRSCSQHVPDGSVNLEEILAAPELEPITKEITEICNQLGKIRLQRGGKKTYHLMVACYFYDQAKVWRALRRVCKKPSLACFVIGDSAPYGIYVPVIQWTGALAKAAGFQSYDFEKTRDRNVKWKNRKHRVPLCEGRLWVRG
jgi:hypothetical protein